MVQTKDDLHLWLECQGLRGLLLEMREEKEME